MLPMKEPTIIGSSSTGGNVVCLTAYLSVGRMS